MASAGYSGTTLAAKLGIAAGTTVLLDGAPEEFVVPGLPGDVTVHRAATGSAYPVIVCFCPDQARLARRWPVMHARTTPAGALWIAWPKRASGIATDLDEHAVRAYALAHGRVDVKVCAIDAVWSGLKNVVRVANRNS